MLKHFNPCTPDCPDRCMGCHATCAKGKLADAIHKQNRDKANKEKAINSEITDNRKSKIAGRHKNSREYAGAKFY